MILDKTDCCGCVKPPGVWGMHGSHWHEHDEKYIEWIILNKLRPQWGAKATDEELRARLEHTKDEAMQKHIKGLLHYREEERARLRRYLGQAVFLENCPAYLAAMRDNHRARKAEEAMSTTRSNAGLRLRG